MRYILGLALLLFFAFAFNSCKKYPDDDNFMHLKTVKKRLCERNFLQDYVYNYVTNTQGNTFPSDNLIFDSNKTFRSGSPYFYTATKWEFLDKKNGFRLTFSNGFQKEYEITRLEKNYLWFKSDSILFEYIVKN